MIRNTPALGRNILLSLALSSSGLISHPAAAQPTQTDNPFARKTPDTWVQFSSDYAESWLESRPTFTEATGDAFVRECRVPCEQQLYVRGKLFRVTAAGMTPSNTFRIRPGSGVANFRVSGGPSTLHTLGVVGLVTGLPVSFAGMTLYGVGSVQGHDSMRTSGLVTLVAGGTLIVASLPLLLAGSTSVRDIETGLIARRSPLAFTF